MLISVANHSILKNNKFSTFLFFLALTSAFVFTWHNTPTLYMLVLVLPLVLKNQVWSKKGTRLIQPRKLYPVGIFNTQVNRSHIIPTDHTRSKLNATWQKWLEMFPYLSAFFWRPVKGRLKGFIIKQFRKVVTLWCNPGHWWCFWLILSQIRLYREGCLRATASSHSVIFEG